MTKPMMVLIALFLYLVIRSVFIEPNLLQVTNYEIENNALQGIRVAFLSDFHLKKRDYKRLDNIVRLTNAQKPDIVLLGGDFAKDGNYSNTMDMEIAASKLSLISAPTYAVLGETDWLSNGKDISDNLKNKGIRVLDNSSIRRIVKGRYVDIAGLADISTGRNNIQRALYRTKSPRILITHNPDIYYNVLDDVSMIFAGHTHGGQFVVPYSPPVFVPSKFGAKFASGLITFSHNPMIISRGLGTSTIPIRFNCKPEIVIVDFLKVGEAKKKKKKQK